MTWGRSQALFAILGLAAVCAVVTAAQGATLAHHYTFTGDGLDSVGTADLEVIGGASFQASFLDLNNASPGGDLHDDQALASGAALDELAATLDNAGGAALSIELWFNEDVGTRYAKVFGMMRDQDNFIYITPEHGETNQVAVEVKANGAVTLLGSGFTPAIDQDYYVAMVIDDANDTLTLYIGEVGGALQTFSTTMTQNLADLDITAFSLGSAVVWPDDDFDGQVDELRIWNGALTPAEVAANFAGETEQNYRYDFDGDSDVDGADADVLYGCVSGPEIRTIPDGCTTIDFTRADADVDGDVDAHDLFTFMTMPFSPAVGIEFVDRWQYTFADPGAGWSDSNFDDAGWDEGRGGFGTDFTPNSRVGTTWDSDDVWMRKSFTILGVPENPALLLYHDEDAEIYFNGVLVDSFTGYVTDYIVVPLDPAYLSALQVGENVMAVHCHQTVGGQFIDAHLVDADHLPELPAAFESSPPFYTELLTPWGATLTPENAWTEYPRPMLQRDSWQNLNGMWDYALTAETQPYFPAVWDGEILVPFCLESKLGGVMRALGQGGAIWYHRTFDVVPVAGKRTILNFEAVDYDTWVYVNGVQVGGHRGGFAPFSVDITDAVMAGTNDLIVRVEDDTEGWQLSGKQRLNPSGIWYTRVSGIWQTVWLEQVSDSHFADIKIATDAAAGSITIRPIIAQPTPGYDILVIVRDAGSIVAYEHDPNAVIELTIPNAKLWSPSDPHLYDLELFLLDSGGGVLDHITSYAGIRTVGKTLGTDGHWRFTLNGEVIFHWGQLDQGWWPDGLLTPPSDEAMIYDIQFQKDAGFNMIRKHIKVEPRRWYYHCDQIGIMVWQDQPSGGEAWPRWTFLQPNPTDATWPDEHHDQYLLEFERMIATHENHPSIVCWIPFNEAWGQHRSVEVGEWVEARDPSRLVSIASGGNWWPVGDVVDNHQYIVPGFPFNLNYDGRFDDYIKVVGEFGGIAWPIEGHLWDPIEPGGGYGNVAQNLTEFTNRYLETINALDNLQNSGVAGGVYTQTTDVEREINGLMTYDRVYKVDPAVLADWHSVLFD